MPVGKDGRFTHPVDEYAGMLVFDANLHIIDHLKAATAGAGDAGSVSPGTVLLRRESYTHSYPHCWRCREPLIYKGVSSWFVEVTAIKQRMLELNEQIRWVPDHIKHGQFGRWLENARDWSITRNRFWGSPVPVWRSDDEAYPRLDVYGSFEELERDFGVAVTDLHRPFVDELTRPNPDDPTGRSTDAARPRRARRVVRLRLDVVRPGALPVREHRLVRAPLPRRLHRRVHRPDPRLVLHAAHPGVCDLRPTGVLDLPLARDRARPRRQQDVEVAAQLPRRARGLRPRRRRCDAVVPDVVADPARREPDRHRAGDPRLGAPGADPAVEQLVVLRALRQRRQARGHLAHRQQRPHGPLHPRQAARLRRRDDRAPRQLRGGQRVRRHPLVHRRADQLVHPALAGALLGGGRGGVRHPVHGPGDGLPGDGAAAAPDRGGDLARPDRRAVRAPHGLAVGRGPARRRRPRDLDGRGPRRLLGRVGAAQGGQPAHPPAPGQAHGGGHAGWAGSRRSSPRSSTSRRSP